MKIEIETNSYNEKRYGRPWIALVDFSTKSGDFQFGDWVGQDGRSGILELECQVGDVVARGQKDHRKPRNSAPEFYIVQEGGNLESVSKAEAYKHWKSDPAEHDPLAEFTIDQLEAELERRRS